LAVEDRPREEEVIDKAVKESPEEDDLEETKDVEEKIEKKPEIPEKKTVVTEAIKPITQESKEEAKQKIRRRIKRTANVLIKAWRFDLEKRHHEAAEKLGETRISDDSWKGHTQVRSVITNNKKLFSKTLLKGKWKSYPMSNALLRKYIPLVNESIKPFWHVPLELDPSLQVLMKVKVAKNGSVLSYEPVEISGNWVFDRSVKKIFANLGQLPPLPKEFPGEVTEIGLRFTSSQTNSN